MIYRFRIILDNHEDVFRDIEIEASSNMEELHNVITQSFGFAGQEMASFYVSNDKWEQGEEIALFDMSEGEEKIRVMHDTILGDTVWEEQTKLIYIYDFLSMWTFLVELAEVTEYQDGQSYPNLMYSHGEIPEDPAEVTFISEGDEDAMDYNEDIDLDPEDYEDLDFDENWN